MPPSEPVRSAKTLHEISRQLEIYPVEAYEFIQQGLAYTVQKVYGNESDEPRALMHVTGQELCEGLRELALHRWGLLARTVLARWNVRRTLDFGELVFAMVENGVLQTTSDDSIEDFRDVYDFSGAFEREYRFEKLI